MLTVNLNLHFFFLGGGGGGMWFRLEKRVIIKSVLI